MKVADNKRNIITTFTKGDIFSKLSYVVFGLANIKNGQVVKGLIFLAMEILYIAFMAMTGSHNLAMMRTLGQNTQGMTYNESLGIYEVTKGDNSMLILLSGVVTLVITGFFIATWLFSIFSGERARHLKEMGKRPASFLEDVKSLANENVHFLFLSVPVIGLSTFTVMPLIYMILMAFTNYDQDHQPPGNLFTWVGVKNFFTLLSTGDRLSNTFWPVLGWTLIWGFAATFSCYFGGMILAMIINSKGIKYKKFCFCNNHGNPSIYLTSRGFNNARRKRNFKRPSSAVGLYRIGASFPVKCDLGEGISHRGQLLDRRSCHNADG